MAFNVSHEPVIVLEGAAPGLLPRAVWKASAKIDAPVAHAAEGCAVESLAVEHLQTAAAWKRLLSQTIQVDFMRKRMCSRMKAVFRASRGSWEVWLKTLTKFAWVPRGQMKALVWPQAAYLHFGVRG